MDDGAAHHIDEPQAAAEINESERDRRHEVMRPMRELKERKDEIKERHDGKSHDEAARRGEEDGEPSAETGEDGEPHRAAKQIKPYSDGALFPTEIFQNEKDAEDLQGERHRRGDRDEGANRDERHAEGNMRHIPRFQLSQNIFFHKIIIIFPSAKSKQKPCLPLSAAPTDIFLGSGRIKCIKCLQIFFRCATITLPNGQLAQLVERLLDVERVRGSSPLLSTIRE